MKRIAHLAPLLLLACGDPVVDGGFSEVLAISSVDPSVATSAGGTTITIQVRAECEEPVVTFDELAATNVRHPGRGVVVVTSPAHAVGDAEVAIRCGDAVAAFDQPFRFSANDVRLSSDIVSPNVDGRVRFADFDGDGVDDLAALRVGDGTVDVFLGNGFDGFELAPFFSITLDRNLDLPSSSLDVSDYSHDGLADLAVASPSVDGALIRVLGRRSDDGFAALELFDVAIDAVGESSPIAAADFDGDGALDVLVAEGIVQDTADIVRYLGASTGDVARVVVGADQRRFSEDGYVLGDFDDDGRADVIVTPFGGNLLFVMGSNDAMPEVVSMQTPSNIVFYDADRWPDLVRTEDLDPPVLAVARGVGPGSFEAEVLIPIACDDCRGLRIVSRERLDLDGNGVPDQIFRTSTQRFFVELQSGVGTAIGPRSAFLGTARISAANRPTILDFDERIRGTNIIGNGLSGLSPLTTRRTAPLVDSVNWGCFGDFEGHRIALGPQRGVPDTMVIRDATPGAPLGEAWTAPLPVGFGETIGACRPARFGDDIGGFFVTTREDETILLRFTKDRLFETASIPATAVTPLDLPNGQVASSAVVTRGKLVEVHTLTPAGAFELSTSGMVQSELPSVFNMAPALLNDDEVVDVVVVGEGIEVHFGRLRDDGTLEFVRQPFAATVGGQAGGTLDDMDDDGDWDVIVTTSLAPEQVLLYENDGGELHLATAFDRSLSMSVLSTCDVDANRHRDLVLNVDDDLGIILGSDGPSPYGGLSLLESGGADFFSVRGVHACSDLDADGLDDVVYNEFFYGTVHAFYNRSR